VTAARERFQRLRDGLHARCFSPAAESRFIGAEVELLALDVEMQRPVPLSGGDRALTPSLRRHGARRGWRELTSNGLTKFEVPGRALVSFEPGGQLEISSVACASPAELVTILSDVVRPMRTELLDAGIALHSLGIDPLNDAHDVPLQLHVDRYERMTEYFDRIGPFGIRMMRQTGAIQVSLDRGSRPGSRWRMLNDLAPYLIAIFANSPRYRGEDTGHRSYRAHCWRQLDITRTGVIPVGGDAAEHPSDSSSDSSSDPASDPASDYATFALAAHDMMRADERGEYRPFSWWLEQQPDDAGWDSHLTTLFPEVRARGHFEVRSCDAVPVEWYAAPIVVLFGLVYDEHAAREAAVLAAESRVLLRAAGEAGLADAALARTARDLFQLGLQGARRLDTTESNASVIETCEEFYRRFTARDACPGDDANLARMRTVRSRSSRV
jgi:glutamate--cysteine ligase